MKMNRNDSETLAETIHASRENGYQTGAPLKRIMTGLTALAVALAVALALILASVVPSHADKRGDDLAKALAAALIIGAIINHVDKKNPPAPAPQPTHVRRPRVPSVCAMEIGHNNGQDWTIVYPERCLREEGFSYRLPECGRTVRIQGHRQRVYSEQCLRNAGFRIGGRRY